MVEERALVISLTGARARVQTQRVSACQSCQLKSTCGQSVLSKIGGEKTIELEIENTLNAKVGDVVLVSIPEEGLLMASSMMFLLPLLLMLVSALVSVQISESEALSVLFGAAGLLTGFRIARVYASNKQRDPRFTPVMSAMALTASSAAICPSSL